MRNARGLPQKNAVTLEEENDRRRRVACSRPTAAISRWQFPAVVPPPFGGREQAQPVVILRLSRIFHLSAHLAPRAPENERMQARRGE